MIPTEIELKYFLELYQQEHFTKTSKKLGISQPTLTQSIAKLESKIGTELFIRTKQGCFPTPSGHLLFEKSSLLIQTWTDIVKKVNVIKNDLIGTFRIGCHQSVAIYSLPNLIKRVGQKAPKIELNIVHDWSRVITEKVINFEIDLGIVINPIKHPDLVMIKIGDDQVTAWVKNKKNVPSVLFTDLYPNQLKEKFKKNKSNQFTNWKIIRTASLEVIRELVLEGAGVGILPERVAKIGNSKINIYDPDFYKRKDEIYLVYRFDTLKSEAGKLLIQTAKTCLSKI